MTKHFYAIDHADSIQTFWAFTSRSARDGFVDDGNRRFAKTRAQADEICRKAFDCDAGKAVLQGFI